VVFIYFYDILGLEMKIQITGKNMGITPNIRRIIDEKIGGLSKFLGNFDSDLIIVDVEVGRPSRHHRSGDIFYAEVNLSLPGNMLRAQAERDDLTKAIVKVRSELKIQIEKYKGQLKK